MPTKIPTANGRSIFVYEKAEIPPGNTSFLPSPPWIMDLLGWTEPKYIYGFMGLGWDDHFTKPAEEFTKPGFWEIFANGLGPVTNEEIRAAEKVAGVNVDETVSRPAMNQKYIQDHALFGEVISRDEVRDGLPSAEDKARFDEVMAGMPTVIDADPAFFTFDVLDIESEEIPSVVPGKPPSWKITAERVKKACYALPGPHCLRRDVFPIGISPRKYPDEMKDFYKPGRDRWARGTGEDSLWRFIWAPGQLLASIQIQQQIEGRPVTMPKHPFTNISQPSPEPHTPGNPHD
jgi:hypothetical protein